MSTRPIIITGAAGRAGRAVVAEAGRREVPVIAVVRDPAKATDLASAGVRVTFANALDPRPRRLGLSTPPRAWVSAVTPFSAPPSSFDGFDRDFYRTVARSALRAAPQRLVVIGLFAALQGPSGRVLEDATLLPPALKPFAQAHLRGLETLQEEGKEIDWLVLAPPPLLAQDVAATGRYRLGTDCLDAELAGGSLSYADLAVAVLDEIERPTRHQEQVAVYA